MTPETKTYFEIQLDQLVKEHYLPEYYYVQVRQSKSFMEKYLSEKIELEKRHCLIKCVSAASK